MFSHLFFILVILVIILLFKFYLDSKNTNYPNSTHATKTTHPTDLPYPTHQKTYAFDNTYDDAKSFDTYNEKFNKMLVDTQNETIKKINNAVEQGVIEGFQSPEDENITYNSEFNVKTIKENSHKYKEQNKNKNNNDSIISYLNKGNTNKIMFFYKASCSYCSEFMPVWYKIVNNLENNVMYEEIDCEKDTRKANEYQISSVPTIILIVNNEKKVYTGNRNYKDIMLFLKYNGVNLVERTFEEFESTGGTGDNDNAPTQPSGNANKSLCPIVTFNSEFDVAGDNYMFQIFNPDGQYGYATGGNNTDKIMTPFTAAYSTVDSYLSSLPDGANISECANSYASQVRGFGLCDKDQLDNILQYQTNVSQGVANPQIAGTDYSSNKKVITAIKNACGL